MSQAGVLTIGAFPTIPIDFITNFGTAIAINNEIEILGNNGITTSGAGNVVTISGVNATAAATVGDAQIGVSAFDSTMFTVTNGFVQLKGGNLGIDGFIPDSGTSLVHGDVDGNVNLVGSGNITTIGSSNTVTFSLDGLNRHSLLVGNSATTIANITVGATGEILIGHTGAFPSWLAPGTTGQYLAANTGSNPSWENVIDLHSARFIVSSGGAADGANYTTISSAITAAALVGGNQTILIQPGTYIENPTLSPGICLTGYQCNGNSGGGVTIVGKITLSSAGTNIISGCILQTNGDYAFVMSGSGACFAIFINCFFIGQNFDVFNSSNTGAGSQFTFRNCNGTLNTTGITWFVSTGTEVITAMNSEFGNSANSTKASTKTGGSLNLNYVRFLSPWSITATSGNWTDTSIICENINQTCLTTATSGTINMYDCVLRAGTASCASAGASTTINVNNAILSSTNANVLTGAGTVQVTANSNPARTTSAYNTTTINRKPFGDYGTFTPTLRFGGGTTGITYSTQTGTYNIVGRTVYFQIRITLTSKGSSSGIADIIATALPTPAAGPFPCSLVCGNLTFASGFLVAGVRNSSGFNILIQNPISASASANLFDTAFANDSNITINGHYFI